MINLNRLIELPFTPKEVTDANLSKFISDHLQRLDKYQTLLKISFVHDTQVVLNEYNNTLSNIDVLMKSRKENSIIIRDSVLLIKDFFRRVGNLLAFVYSKNSSEYIGLFPNGLSEVSSINNGSLVSMVNRVKIFLDERKNEDTFGKLNIQFLEINEPLQMIIEDQTEIHNRLSVLSKEKNMLKENLIRCFTRNTYYCFAFNCDKPKSVSKLYNQKIINPRILNTN